MTPASKPSAQSSETNMVNKFKEFAKLADYSLMNSLNADPDAREDGNDHRARQVFSGHFVPVTPTPIAQPEYVSHSKVFFEELGLSDELALDEAFLRVFSGDLSAAVPPMRPSGLGDRLCAFDLWHRIYSAVSVSHRQWLW